MTFVRSQDSHERRKDIHIKDRKKAKKNLIWINYKYYVNSFLNKVCAYVSVDIYTYYFYISSDCQQVKKKSISTVI